MTEPNNLNPKKLNGTSDKDAVKSSREIEREIAETRRAMSSDIQALNDKFSPANVKQQAKEVKDAVVDKAVELKEAATDTALEAKDAVVGAMQDIGDQAARAGSATWQFTKANAVPLAVLGVGAGMLIAKTRRSNVYYEPGHARRAALTKPHVGRMGARSDSVLGQATEGLVHAKTAALDTASRGAEYVQETASRGYEYVQETATRSYDYVQQGLRSAGTASRDFAAANPLLTAFVAIAAGVGVGMMLPATERESRLLAPPRAKLKQMIGDVRDAATDVAQVAKDTATDTLQAMK